LKITDVGQKTIGKNDCYQRKMIVIGKIVWQSFSKKFTFERTSQSSGKSADMLVSVSLLAYSLSAVVLIQDF
jgi:hypothetical protein